MNYHSKTYSKAKEHKSKMHLVNSHTWPSRVPVKYQNPTKETRRAWNKKKNNELSKLCTLQQDRNTILGLPKAGERAAPAPLSTHDVHTPKPAPRSELPDQLPKFTVTPVPPATKWPREVVWMGQDLDFSCSNCACVGCACPVCSRGEHRALVSHKLN